MSINKTLSKAGKIDRSTNGSCFFTIAYNEEDYVHPAHCGVQSCRKVIQLMRAQHFLNAVQRAGEHRRVLGVCGFLIT